MLKHIDEKQMSWLNETLELLNALADRTRQQIIRIFSSKAEACVSEIAEQFELSRPTISHHLNLMRRARILNARKQGKEIYYSFNGDYVIGMIETLLGYLKRCC